MKVCLVGSSGGHLTHLYMLKPFWENKKRFWVTFDKEDARSLLNGEKVYPCYYPTNRNIKNLIRNTVVAWKVLHKEKPDYFKWSCCICSIFLSWEIIWLKADIY